MDTVNIIYIEVAGAFAAIGIAAPIIYHFRKKKTETITVKAKAKNIRPQFDEDDDLRVEKIEKNSSKKIKSNKKQVDEDVSSDNIISIQNENIYVDIDDTPGPVQTIKERKINFFKNINFKKKEKIEKTEEIYDDSSKTTSSPITIQEQLDTQLKEQTAKTVNLDEEDDLILVSEKNTDKEKLNINTNNNDDDNDNILINLDYQKQNKEYDYVIPSDVEKDNFVIPKTIIEEEKPVDLEDEERDFNLIPNVDEEQRRQWLLEMTSENYDINENQKETSHIITNIENENTNNIKTDKELIHEENIREENKNQTEVVRSYQWTTFLGQDAQSLGIAERENLVLLLKNMKDPNHLSILISAYQEEQKEELRPKVLAAIIESYYDPSLADLFNYAYEFGSNEEKQLAKNALDRIGV